MTNPKTTLDAFLAATEGWEAKGAFRIVQAGTPSGVSADYAEVIADAETRSAEAEPLAVVEVQELRDGEWVRNTRWIAGICVEDEPETLANLLAPEELARLLGA